MAQYHVTLNGQGYVLDLGRYAKRVREPFVARQGQGSVAVEDLRGPEQVLVISDWSGGEGYVQHDPDAPGRFRSGSGIDGYTLPGSLRLGPYVSLIGTIPGDQIRVMKAYGAKLYFGCSSGLIYSWDGAVFANPHTVPGAPVVLALETYLGKLYGGNSANGNLLSFDGTTWTAAAAVAGGPIRWLQNHYRQAAQYLYVAAASAGPGGIGRIYFWDGAALSLGQLDPEESTPCPSFVLEQRCYFVFASGREWGIYSVDESSSGGTWRRHAVVRGLGFPISATVFEGEAYLGDAAGGRLFSFDGDEVRVALELGSPTAPHAGFLPAYSWGKAIWMASMDGGSTTLYALRYDGVTRFRAAVVAGLTGTDARVVASWNDALYVGTSTPAAGKVYKVDPTLFGGSGTLTSGLIDFGIPGTAKLLRSVTIVTGTLVSGHSIQVEYQLEDTGSWTSLGTLSTAGATTATYSFASNVTCRQVSFRLTLTGVAGTSASPVLYELAVRYVPRPAVTREWELAVVLEGTAELPLSTLDGQAEPLTGAQLAAALWTAAGAAGPVTLVDLDGTSYAVYVQDVREEIAQISQRRGYQRLGRVTLVEAA